MSIKEKLLKTIFTVDENPKTQKQEVKSEQTFVPKEWQQPSSSTNAYEEIGLTPKYKEHFKSVMKEKNLSGPDYYELDEMMEKMESQIPERKTRIIAAYAALSSQGLTKEKVKESAQEYLKALDEDYQEFQKNINVVSEKEVSSREVQLEKNMNEIKNLEKRIEELNKQNSEIKHQKEIERKAIESNSKVYEKELNIKKDKIKSDIFEFEQTINF